MNQVFHNLYFGEVNEIPKKEDGDEFDVLYCYEDDEALPDLEKNINLKYLVIVLQKTMKNVDDAIITVKSEWKDITDLEIDLDLVTSDKNKIDKSFRREVLNLELEKVSFKAIVIGFDKTSLKLIKSARKSLLRATPKSKWNFWS